MNTIKIPLLLLIISFCSLSSLAKQGYIDSLESVVKISPNDTSRVILLNKLAFEYHKKDTKRCLNLATEALEVSTKIRYKKGQALSFGNIGLYHAITGSYEKSLYNYEQAIKHYREIDNKSGVGKILGNIGVVYQMQTDYNSALDYFLQALKIEESIGSKKEKAKLFGNLGNLYEQQDEYTTSLNYYQKSLSIFQELNDNQQIGCVYGNIGLVHKNRGEYKKALEYFNRALTIDSLFENKLGLSDNWANLGSTYSKLKEYDRALESYQNALDLDEKMKNISGVAFDLAGLSKLYLLMSKDNSIPLLVTENNLPNLSNRSQYLKAALELGKKAEICYFEIGESNYLIYQTLEEIYTQMGDYKSALKYKELFWSNKTAVFSTEKAKEFARFEEREQKLENKNKIAMLESESAQNYIILVSISIITILLFVLGVHFFYQLKQKKKINLKLEQLNAELKIVNDSKDKFFSILAHDLINPIGGIASALRIFKRDRESMNENDVSEYVSTLVKASFAASNLLNNLLEWSRIQKSQIPFTPESHNLNSLILSNIQLIQNLAKAKDISINYLRPKEIMVSFDEYMMNSVIGNLLSNAIKFTNEKGTVEINVNEYSEFIKISIEDNGVGMTDKQMNNLFDIASHGSTPGTKKEAKNPYALGMPMLGSPFIARVVK